MALKPAVSILLHVKHCGWCHGRLAKEKEERGEGRRNVIGEEEVWRRRRHHLRRRSEERALGLENS